MRASAIVFIASLTTALLFGFIGQATVSDALYLLSGVAFLTAIGAALAMIPWVRNLPWPERMELLFPRVVRGERLDPIDGSVQRR